MTINMLLILALAVGAGTSQSLEPASTPEENIRIGKIAGNCYINGVWYNPCPSEEPIPRDPHPTPEILMP